MSYINTKFSSQDCEIETKTLRKDLNLSQKENTKSNQENEESKDENKIAQSDIHNDEQGF